MSDRPELINNSIGYLVRKGLEFSGALVVVGFVLSVVANQLVFSHWHLDFLQVASPADVMMSGISLGLGLSAILIPAFTVIFFMILGLEKIP